MPCEAASNSGRPNKKQEAIGFSTIAEVSCPSGGAMLESNQNTGKKLALVMSSAMFATWAKLITTAST